VNVPVLLLKSEGVKSYRTVCGVSTVDVKVEVTAVTDVEVNECTVLKVVID
jgi:hypothetical protein